MMRFEDEKRKRACCRQCLKNLKVYGKQLTSLDHFPQCVLISEEQFKDYLAGKIINEYDPKLQRWFWKER